MFLTFSSLKKETSVDSSQFLVKSDGGGSVKSFSETIVITEEGPRRDCVYSSTLECFSDRNFKATVVYEPRLVPVVYCTTLVVPGPPIFQTTTTKSTTTSPPSTSPLSPKDSSFGGHLLVSSLEDDSVDFSNHVSTVADLSDLERSSSPVNEVKYFEEVALRPRWMPVHYAEGVSAFPRETKTYHCTTLTYDANSTQCRFIVGLEIWPGANAIDLGPSCCYEELDVDDQSLVQLGTEDLIVGSPTSGTPLSVGTLHTETAPVSPLALLLGSKWARDQVGSSDPLVLEDHNCNVYNSTKDILVNGV